MWSGDAGSIKINGLDYALKSAHWHSPSEHSVNGKRCLTSPSSYFLFQLSIRLYRFNFYFIGYSIAYYLHMCFSPYLFETFKIITIKRHFNFLKSKTADAIEFRAQLMMKYIYKDFMTSNSKLSEISFIPSPFLYIYFEVKFNIYIKYFILK